MTRSTAAERESLTILHGSDLHFGRFHSPSAATAFLRASEQIAPDLIVISGDFTQRAKIREYEDARRYLDQLPGVPKILVPGNHDVPLYRVFERLFAPYRNYSDYIQPDLDTVVRIPGATLVGLNSAAPRRAIVNGRILQHQLDFVATSFGEAPDRDLKAVVVHHHLAPAPDYEGDRPLPGARAVLRALSEVGVDLVMGGHLHRSYIGNSLDVSPLDTGAQGIVIVQCGTTTSVRGRARERAKNSFNVVRSAPGYLEVTHHIHFDEGGSFEAVSTHKFPRSPHRRLNQGQESARPEPTLPMARLVPEERV